MTFLVASFPEFLQLLKIVLWISIPFFVIATIVVVFLHYRNKRKQAFADIPGFALQPELEALAIASPVFSFRQKFQLQLAAGEEQYAALQKDFMQAKQTYSALVNEAGGSAESETEIQKQFKQYELKIAQLQQALDYLKSNAGTESDLGKSKDIIAEKEREVKRLYGVTESLNRELTLLQEQNDSKASELKKMDQLLKEYQESARKASTETRDLQRNFQEQNEDRDKHHFDENNRLNEQLRDLHDKFRKLEEENGTLQAKIQETRFDSGQVADTEGRIASLQDALIKAEQQLLEWKNKVVDAGSLEEIVEEKKKQIEFLQNQLDQKIRNSRQLEQRSFDMDGQLQGLQKELEEAKITSKFLIEDRQIKEEELQNLGRQIEEGGNENRLLKQAILDKDDRITLVETHASELRARITGYEEELGRHADTYTSLQEQLEESKQHIQFLEAKLRERQELLSRLHADLSAYASQS